jgi:hypothetical protein
VALSCCVFPIERGRERERREGFGGRKKEMFRKMGRGGFIRRKKEMLRKTAISWLAPTLCNMNPLPSPKFSSFFSSFFSLF